MKNRSLQAFTLAELLVSLSVLGLVAAFAIPKVLIATSDASLKAVGRETFATMAGAFQAYKADKQGVVGTNLTVADLLPYIGYSKAGAATDMTNETTTTNGFIVFSTGAVLGYDTTDTFAPNTTGVLKTGTLGFEIDPDGAGTSADAATAFLAADGRTWMSYSNYGTGATGVVSSFNNDYNIEGDALGYTGKTTTDAAGKTPSGTTIWVNF
jgi:prepilin-type N-terminal cleavage/methylation domain-containing protein